MWEAEESIQDLEVGDKVTVHDHYNGPIRLTKVARITKTMIVTVHNSRGREEKWSRKTGRNYKQDSNTWYTGNTIAVTKDKDHYDIIKRIAKTHIPRVDWDKVTEATLKEFWSFYKLLPRKE